MYFYAPEKEQAPACLRRPPRSAKFSVNKFVKAFNGNLVLPAARAGYLTQQLTTDH